MSLGYALLHRNRIQTALDAGPRKQTYDDLTDFVFGIMGTGAEGLGSGLNNFVQSRSERFNDILEQQYERFAGSGGPISFIRNLLDRLDSVEGITNLGKELFSRLDDTGGAVLRDTLHQHIDNLCDALPRLNGQALNQFLMEQVNGMTSVLEHPLAGGRRDITAHRAFRSAVTLRQYISEGLDEAPWADAGFDAIWELRRVLHEVVAGIDDRAVSGLMDFIQTFKSEYGGVLSACFEFNTSVSTPGGDGPRGMPEEDPDYLDEVKAVSHENPGAIWGLDLATNTLATFFLVWESVRTDNYKGRWLDGTLSVLTILWHAGGHTLVRSKWPEVINRERGNDSGGDIFKNWFFSDQGNFSLNLLLRLFQSFHDGGNSNWALSFAQRLLKYFSNVTLVRSFYYFTRSVWYFKDRAEEENPQRVSMSRMFWAVWGPMSWIAAFFSFFLSWDDFSLEEGFTTRTIVLLVLGLVLGFIAGYVVLWVLAGQRPGSLPIAPDWWTLILSTVCAILALIALILILADLESSSKGGAIAGAIVVGVLTLFGIGGIPLFFHSGTGEHSTIVEILIEAGMFCLLLSGSLLVAGILPFFLWWFFIDDGRDKHGLFDDKDADTSPYKLPYPSGENWLCGQAVHGIFSHIPSKVKTSDDVDNEYGYDFNEKENKNALAARDGIVIDIIKDNKNGSDEKNSIDVMHTSWHSGHDPGTDDERVLTYSVYVHLSRNRAWVDVGHRFTQGVHIADIDSTGRSAQHHLHFHAQEYQRRVENPANSANPASRNMTLPVVFRDSSTHGFRNFPFLTWIPGKGHIEGKPLSMAFYTSENDEQQPLVNPLVISLFEEGTPSHEHWILVDRTLIENGPLPDSLTVSTTVNERHFHEITLTKEQLADIMGMRDLSSLTVSSVNGHDHALAGYKYLQSRIDIWSSENGSPDHGHWLMIDQRTLGWEWGTTPAGTQTLTTNTALSGAASHSHTIDLTHDQLFDILRRRRFPTGLTTAAASGHEHKLLNVRRWPSEPEMKIVEPPPAQLFAENPGPYQLVGDQMVVRVNERATEYFFYGVHRPLLRGEIALDRGLGNSHLIDIGGTIHTPNATDTTVQGSLESFNTVLSAIPVQMRAEPVIVVESVQRGSGASIVVAGGSPASLTNTGEGRGTGEFSHIDQVPRAELVTHFTTYLTSGWPNTPPGGIHSQVDTAGRLELLANGAAVAFPDSRTRNSDVLRRLYDTGNTHLRATGDIPLSSGRLDFTGSYGVPVLGTAAQVVVDTGHAAFASSDLTATPLEVTVRGRTTEINLVAGDNATSVLARKIALAVEGVRAWESGTNLIKVQTTAVGTGIQLDVRKRLGAGDFHQQNSGGAPSLSINTTGCSFTGAISDSNAVSANQCCAMIHTAAANATLPYDAGIVIDQIQMDGDQLVIRVNDSHTIGATAVAFSGGGDPFAFTQNGPREIRSTTLSADVDLNGPGWVELDIDGNVKKTLLKGIGGDKGLGCEGQHRGIPFYHAGGDLCHGKGAVGHGSQQFRPFEPQGRARMEDDFQFTVGGLFHFIGKALGALGVEIAGRIVEVEVPLGFGKNHSETGLKAKHNRPASKTSFFIVLPPSYWFFIYLHVYFSGS